MENLTEIKNLINLIQLLENSDNFEENTIINNSKITISKDNSDIKIKIESIDPKEPFDDSSIKHIISSYKKNIEELDDCLFINALEEIGKSININHFNNLLDKDSFTKQEADEVNAMIEYSSRIIQTHLQEKIQSLIELYDRF